MARSIQVTVLARKIKTNISISVTPLEGDAPFDITVTGILKDTQNRAVSGRTVNLYINNAIVTSTSTDSAGNYSFVYTINDVGTYIIETEFPGDANYLGCAESQSIGVTELNLIPVVIAVAGAVVLGYFILHV